MKSFLFKDKPENKEIINNINRYELKKKKKYYCVNFLPSYFFFDRGKAAISRAIVCWYHRKILTQEDSGEVRQQN